MARLQRLERQRVQRDPNYIPRIRTAIVTSRNAPAHRRLVTTLRSWGITVDETLLLGGLGKNRVLEIFRPHIFFDDQRTHALPAAAVAPFVHVPFGIQNRA
jgi:5'-nucleotidase